MSRFRNIRFAAIQGQGILFGLNNFYSLILQTYMNFTTCIVPVSDCKLEAHVCRYLIHIMMYDVGE